LSSRDYKGERVIIWPSYLDASLPRSRGRRLSLQSAIRSPRIDEIVKAARQLGLDPIVEDRDYPRRWWADKRRVIVLKRGSKLETLKAIAEEIRGLRSRSQ